MFEVESGFQTRNIFSIIYGQPGCGKTHLASRAKSALIGDLEDGSAFLDVHRVKIGSHEDLIKFIQWAGGTDYQTIVLDSLTAIERYATAHVLKAMQWQSLETPGYGKGYAEMCDAVKRVINGVEYLRDKKRKDVVLIAHARVRTVTDPTQESYDRWEFDAHKNLTNAFVSVADAVMYLRPAVHTVTTKGDKRTFASGRRELITIDRGGALAKNRLRHVPELIEFEHCSGDELNAQYQDFWNTIKDGAEV